MIFKIQSSKISVSRDTQIISGSTHQKLWSGTEDLEGGLPKVSNKSVTYPRHLATR
jgi:hypothetical protein